jgi:hypothetical protein
MLSVSVENVHRVLHRSRTPKVDRNCFCHARFLRHRNGPSDEVLSICLAQENREMCP